MYPEFFGLIEHPFSIVPNSRYLYLSQRHKEAMAHLQAGLGDGGGFAMLTGEVGTGKTTVAKAILSGLPPHTRAGFILNPTFSERELLEAICDEFAIKYPQQATLKQLSQVLYQFLLNEYANGIQVLLVIDEAQHLAPDVLEQLRLLTNLETESRKLLKVLLIGQPELQYKLQLPQLRQLAQRITGRYHLLPLDVSETAHYIRFRLQQAGGDGNLFSARSAKWIAQQTHGIPRLINLACDAALKGAYQAGERAISLERVKQACTQIMSFQSTVYQPQVQERSRRFPLVGVMSALIGIGSAAAIAYWLPPYLNQQIQQQWPLPAPVEAAEQTVFPTTVEDQLKGATDREQAMKALYAVWGYDASVIESFCQRSASSQLECEQNMGSWQDLKKLNLPVMLTLNLRGLRTYAVLYHLQGDEVELLINDKRVRIGREWIEPLWQGEYRVVWQPSFYQTLRAGMRGEDITLLDNKLSRLLGEPERNVTVYDKEVKRKVEVFQRWQNMQVDGIAGRQTLRQLDLLTQQSGPRLTEVQ
ncbi:ExeA family protein [Vibrio fluvialis]|uniref:ExeA family protein n=1 Tax=Vibrio fluvialis TaxID=676 RepID=UPI001302A602|nr:ExeA family protein [Vibrio fluvialis]EKO3394265.1 AAA family ATPase [Vibrio fluvialis]EKO3909230.1 AAA family ATPase [Vibrio fluvialis]MBY8026815.1 AAA family ATPase [Vibrio fluvialis]MCG6361561.1 AAA family ATPase [Vibrio fluvialis]MCG6415739.1 AAA family ATPase [Vibrio fluvialis]